MRIEQELLDGTQKPDEVQQDFTAGLCNVLVHCVSVPPRRAGTLQFYGSCSNSIGSSQAINRARQRDEGEVASWELTSVLGFVC